MDNASYVSLSRQAGLMRELNIIANNIANLNTTGFRRESVLFAEHVDRLEQGDPALSIATMDRRYIDFSEGEIRTTNSKFDFAIQGEGFFLIETEEGPRLSRAGSFSLNANGELVNADGRRVLDEGGGALVIPPDAMDVTVSSDGAISVDGQPVGRLGVVTADPAGLVREGNNLFRAEQGYQPADGAKVIQSALEGANVSAVTEIAHLIEVQRTYEAGQKFLEQDDSRIRSAIRALGQG